MPRKNLVKNYVANGQYHIFNRGIDGRKIFMDESDYLKFLSILKQSLSHPPSKESLQKEFTFNGSTFKGIPRQPKNFHEEIELIAFCLVPNSFHFILKQKDKGSMEGFMRSISTRYSMYFNKKYDREGSLFQGTYKAAQIQNQAQMLFLSRYIHRKPLEHVGDIEVGISSYLAFTGKVEQDWIKPNTILDYYDEGASGISKKFSKYSDFVLSDSEDTEHILEDLRLD